MIGGLRALLMHAAHPLVVAGADASGDYARDPWGRLQRTLSLYLQIIFGSTADALAAARAVNRRHRRVSGVDPATGGHYRALDQELLLWVHACLVLGFLHFDQQTVQVLSARGRQEFHEEQIRVAELLGLRRSSVPARLTELDGYTRGVIASGVLTRTPGSARVARIVRRPPPGTPLRRALLVAQRLAFLSLPPELAEIHGARFRRADHAAGDLLCALLSSWQHLPAHHRYIGPYRRAAARLDAPTTDPRPGGLFWEIEYPLGPSEGDRDDR
jgi:uncharacterized protein (DUF2236 family)